MNASSTVCAACSAELQAQAQFCAQCGAAVSACTAPDASASAQPSEPEQEGSYLERIRAQQKRVAEQLKPLETGRGWWKKYF